VTTNNDTPRIFGPEAGTDEDFSSDWTGLLAGPPAADVGDEDEPSGAQDDQAHPVGREWGGWDEYAEPEPAGPGSWQPAFYPREEEHPVGAGYTPVPPDLPSARDHQPTRGQPGYAQEPGYAVDGGYADYPPDAGYARQVGYPQDPGYGPGHEDYPAAAGYPPDLGLVADVGHVPPMEPLPDPELPPLTFPPAPAMEPAVGVDSRGGSREDVRALPPVPAPAPARETSDSLTTESLLHGKRAAPGSGWRRNVYRATGGLLRFGESAAEMRRRDLINRVRTPVAGGHHRVAVLSLKGGVGKTTTAVGLGATLATLRGDRVIAVDANPDRGTLSDKVRLETAATIRDLLNERDQVRRYADVRAFTSQAPSRLEVLASDRDPGVSVAFGADDYCDAARVLEHFYSICITDCGTGLLHSAMSGVLRLADQIVLVSSPSVDGARSASATLDWLEAHNCRDLVRNAVVVLSAIRPRSKSTVDLDRLEHHFAARCRAVTRIPYDPHLEEGAEVELELLSGETAEAYLALAAIVGDGLAWPRRLTSRPSLP
jgi:MinD-like ATPase involved in chromosome partitioning or flagellar assembly